MRTYKFNGEYWYRSPRLLKRIRMWLVWLGGWEKPNGMGWAIRRSGPTPVSILGHRATLYSWGVEFQVSGGMLVITWPQGSETQWRAYISRDGTPTNAHEWILGAPNDVTVQADAHEVALRERWAA